MGLTGLCPALKQVLGGYLHEDFAEEFGSADEALRSAAKDQGAGQVIDALAELDALLRSSFTDEQLTDLIEGLTTGYSPVLDGWEIRSWLEHVQTLLAEGIEEIALVSAVPVVPARDIAATTAWYRDRLGFSVLHAEREYGIVRRDRTWIHFWGPSGIDLEESDTMIRIGVRGIDALHERCQREGIVHPNAPLEEKPWGSREFSVVDRDGNLVTFFQPAFRLDQASAE